MHYTGNMAWLVMLVDVDASAEMTFSEIRIYELGESGSISLFQKWSATRNWASVPTSLRNPGDDPDGDGKTNLKCRSGRIQRLRTLETKWALLPSAARTLATRSRFFIR